MKEENINRVNDGIPTMSRHLDGSEYKLLRQRNFRLFRDRCWTFYLRDFLTVGSWPAPEFIVLQRMWQSGVDWTQLDLDMFLFVFCWGGEGRAGSRVSLDVDQIIGRMFLNFKRKKTNGCLGGSLG